MGIHENTFMGQMVDNGLSQQLWIIITNANDYNPLQDAYHYHAVLDDPLELFAGIGLRIHHVTSSSCCRTSRYSRTRCLCPGILVYFITLISTCWIDEPVALVYIILHPLPSNTLLTSLDQLSLPCLFPSLFFPLSLFAGSYVSFLGRYFDTSIISLYINVSMYINEYETVALSFFPTDVSSASTTIKWSTDSPFFSVPFYRLIEVL